MTLLILLILLEYITFTYKHMKSPTDSIVNGLRKAATELEELQLQMALGKLEARDAFENLKKELHANTENLKISLQQVRNSNKLRPLVNTLEHLQVQLALGLADTKEQFEHQRKKIETSLHEFEKQLYEGSAGNLMAEAHLEMEKLKSKMHLLALGYELKTLGLEQDITERRKEFEKKLIALRTKFSLQEEKAGKEWKHFKQDMKNAFHELKSALLPKD